MSLRAKRLPLFQRGADGPAKGTPIATVTEADVRRFAANGRICGECRFFEPGHAQAELARQSFVPQLVRDYEWKIEHAFISPVNESGLCSQHDGLLTGVLHAACDAFRENNGKIKREAKPAETRRVREDFARAKRMQAERLAAWRAKHGLDR